MVSRSGYRLPALTHRSDGGWRRVGFELEFSGIGLEQTVSAICQALKATPGEGTAAQQRIEVPDLGEFQVELDWAFLKRVAAEQSTESGPDWVQPLSQAAEVLVPVEVVCPPISVAELDRLDPLVSALRAAGAQGTEESLLAAYGVHINPELPALDAPVLSAYLRAFCLLQWWLVEHHEVNLARKISPYIDLYPEAYVEWVLDRKAPDMERIFADYLQHNATRNRALDLLPLLAHIDEQRVRSVVDDPRIKSRPTFHYRLPNCHIERPDWALSSSWNTWCQCRLLKSPKSQLEMSPPPRHQ
ncbi:amidoligase family protein [Marinobacterium sp. D7]|uniref:amidoligase family protein n=1 Tax=Marinobacterium ramblicola TaxID=2849041 RepID=UPI001C2D6EA8|nr:amidoligase family protein [Marinobacterium ramblicola]MBV1787546.1 amidoligase family protein [Marinobacterium ramblicola]